MADPKVPSEMDVYRELDEAVSFIRVMGEALINAGGEPGDRTVILKNLRKLISVGTLRPEPRPNKSMQELLDAGLNAFGLQLFAESVAGKGDAVTFNPFTFKFRNIKITLEPDGKVDTRHH